MDDDERAQVPRCHFHRDHGHISQRCLCGPCYQEWVALQERQRRQAEMNDELGEIASVPAVQLAASPQAVMSEQADEASAPSAALSLTEVREIAREMHAAKGCRNLEDLETDTDQGIVYFSATVDGPAGKLVPVLCAAFARPAKINGEKWLSPEGSMQVSRIVMDVEHDSYFFTLPSGWSRPAVPTVPVIFTVKKSPVGLLRMPVVIGTTIEESDSSDDLAQLCGVKCHHCERRPCCSAKGHTLPTSKGIGLVPGPTCCHRAGLSSDADAEAAASM